MVDEQLVGQTCATKRVLEAMRRCPPPFVPPEYRHMAYCDGPLPIGSRQTISQPYIVALMTQLLRLEVTRTPWRWHGSVIRACWPPV